MTCIVGIQHGGKVYIGGDSAGVSGLSLTVRSDEKVFKRGSYVFGFTSSFRMGQILRYCGTLPSPVGKDLDEFMCTTFVNSLIENFETHKFGRKVEDAFLGGTFLVGVKGALFEVNDDFQVGKSADGFAAVGCGYDVARGAMFATMGWKDPRKRIVNALEAAERFSAGVRGPFHVVHK